MAWSDLELPGGRRIPWHLPKPPSGLSPVEVLLGTDPVGMGLQVAVADHSGAGDPSRESLRALHKARQANKVFPLVVVVQRGNQAWVFGPSPDAEVIRLPLSRAERLLQAALGEPNGMAARQRLAGLQQAAASGQQAGVVNQGLFASHYLQTGAPDRPDWQTASQDAGKLLALRHRQLIGGLGFDVLDDGQALLLSQHAATRAVAVLLDAEEQFDAGTARLGVSPVAFGLALAAKREVPWLVLLRGSQIRLYPARPGVGVGQKGQADTWFEMDLAVVDDEQAPLLPLVFSAHALAPGGSTDQLLAGSAQFAVELGARLRDRVYARIIPDLSQAVAAQLPALGIAVDKDGLDRAYRLTMRILFRLLFQAYAEDRDLLPYTRSAQYRKHSLKQWALEHAGCGPDDFDAGSTVIWDDLLAVWKVIDNGNKAWGVPAYNGGLFGSENHRHPEGHQLTRLALDDKVLGTVLMGLLVDDVESGGIGAVDFRSLSVREFGTIYEGLLESELSVAATDLALDKNLAYIPAKPGDKIVAATGSVYFHSASGERKATGTYFTPHIVVEHLLVRSLDPVLDEHLDRVRELLDAGDQTGAADAFFDFRVADLAMGSAHFLTAAIDHIEAKMRDFLTERPVPRVTTELAALEQAARDALGPDAAAVADIDPSALLRRQIARRCIYGLDINPMAVDLARLAVWITTFVPGLPMSSLDHNLVAGNSLNGVGTIEEALGALDPESVKSGQLSVFTEAITDALGSARDLLLDVANAGEATKADVTKGAEQAAKALADAEPARLLFDAVVAGRLGVLNPGMYFDAQRLQDTAASPDVQAAVRAVRPVHFPFLFPEVFLRDNPGFDVVLGNPPWEELMVEEPKFWLPLRPGLMGLKPAQLKSEIEQLRSERPEKVADVRGQVETVAAERRLLLAGPYPGLGKGDIDLYRAFAWRFWDLLRRGGALGVVVPRSLLNAAGGAQWRETILRMGGMEVTTILNTARWAFDMEARYSIALVTAFKGSPSATVEVSGPFASETAFALGATAEPGRIAVDILRTAATGAAFPQLPGPRAVGVFTQLRSHPRLDQSAPDWDFRAVREFDATNDRKTFDAGPGHGRWPVYGGSAFNIWQPDIGEYYAWADPAVVTRALAEKRRRQANIKSSAFHGLPGNVLNDDGTLPCRHPRIAFRDVTRANDTRTMICALVPGDRVLTNKAPYLWRATGRADVDAYLLGVLSSIPLDWYARRYVEISMNLHILNGLPVPRPPAESPLRARVIEIAGRLAAVDDRYADWAQEVGVPVGSVKTLAEKQDLITELDALVALLYGLTEDQVRVVFETFHVGWEYRPRLAAVLEHYKAWEGSA